MSYQYRVTLGIVGVWSALIAAQQPVGPRRVMTTGRPLVEQVRSEDRHLILEINASPPLGARPQGQSRMTWLAQSNDVIAVARVEGKRPQFVVRNLFENTPAPLSDANWIVSVVQARVERVLKTAPQMTLEERGLIVFEEDGGIATVGNTTVEAVVPWIRPMQVGRKYLIGGRIENGEFVKGLTYEEGPLGLLNSVIVPVPPRPGTGPFPDQQSADEFEQWTLDQAVFEFERELSKSAPR
jgi:hypothetical protein